MVATAILVHGAWHGTWYWSGVRAGLAERGVASVAVSLPSCGADAGALGGLAEDAAALRAAIDATEGPLVVVGHSYAGVVVTEAVDDPRVDRLVYLCAFLPAEGQSLVALLPPGEPPPYVEFRADGIVTFVEPLARDTLYNDCDDAVAEEAVGRLVLHTASAVTAPVSRAAWRTIPSTYVVCTHDRTIPPDLQRTMAASATDVVEIPTDHSPMLSAPARVAEIVAAAAAR